MHLISVALIRCIDCEVGKYADAKGTSGLCTPCPAGTWSEVGSATCDVCEVNFYAELA